MLPCDAALRLDAALMLPCALMLPLIELVDYVQATFAIDLVEASLKAVGAKLTDTIRTRIFVKR